MPTRFSLTLLSILLIGYSLSGCVAPAPTPTASPTPNAPAPKVISFTVNPTTTLGLNQTLDLAWVAEGQQAELCPITASGPTECQPVPLQGQQTLTGTAQSATFVALGLKVATGQTFVWATVPVNLCPSAEPWFFANPPARCPNGAALASPSTAQTFEHGFMLWLQATNTFYIFETNATSPQTFMQLQGPLNLNPGAATENRVGETPPTGYIEPTGNFGLLWRGEVVGVEGLQQRLGWATAPEATQTTSYQCETIAHPHLWSCYLLSPQATILHLYPDSSAQAQFLWEVYPTP